MGSYLGYFMDFINIARSLAALGLTLGILLGLTYLVKRFGLMQGIPINANAKRMSIKEQLWLDTGKTRLLIVNIDNQEKLLLVTNNGAKLLQDLETKTSNNGIENAL